MNKLFYFLSISVLSSVILACSSTSKGVNPPDENAAKTYYVAVTGNDQNSGDIGSPVKTINYALSLAKAGDTVMLRGGIYNQTVAFPKSGLLGKLITLKAYPGETPKIDGTGMSVSGDFPLVTINGMKCITLEGIDICNLTNTAPMSDPKAISINGEARYITIKNCNIYNIKSSTLTFNSTDWRSAHAILVLGTSDAVPISNLVIDGCNIYDIRTGTSETITLAGNIDGFTFSNNKVYNVENIGLIIAGGDNLNPNGNIAVNFARNGVVSNNEFYNNTQSLSPEVPYADHGGAIAIYVCGGANTVIERNKVYNSDRGIGLISESDKLATKDCIVRNNFVYNCYRTGIYLGDYLGYTIGGTKNCYVVNNTLFFNNAILGAFHEIEGEIRLTENCFNNVIKNNLIYGRPTDVFIHKYTATGSGNVIDNNLYFTTGTPQWMWNSVDGAPITDFTIWKSACGGDANSRNGLDPLLLSVNPSAPNLHIQPSSPAKNAGTIISTDVHGTLDIDGNPRIVNGQISIGAQQ